MLKTELKFMRFFAWRDLRFFSAIDMGFGLTASGLLPSA
jgi:hypothetical protein